MDVISTEHPAKAAGKALTETLCAYAKNPILLMVSGGSALSVLDSVESTVLGQHLTLTVLDERFSGHTSINNFAQLEHTAFYSVCMQSGVHTIKTKVCEGERLQDLCERFETALRAWKEQHSDGVIIVTMGIGIDGHTAGIFPGKYNVDFTGDAWVVGYHVPKEVHQHTDRVTVTYTFLRRWVTAAVVYAVGPAKHRLVQSLHSADVSIQETPAAILKELKQVVVFTRDSD